jgi:hypothetical protein
MVMEPPTMPLMLLRSSPTSALHAITGLMVRRSLSAALAGPAGASSKAAEAAARQIRDPGTIGLPACAR